jgi:hypothetical protein
MAGLGLGLLQFLFKTFDLFCLVDDELNGGSLLGFHVVDDWEQSVYFCFFLSKFGFELLVMLLIVGQNSLTFLLSSRQLLNQSFILTLKTLIKFNLRLQLILQRYHKRVLLITRILHHKWHSFSSVVT